VRVLRKDPTKCGYTNLIEVVIYKKKKKIQSKPGKIFKISKNTPSKVTFPGFVKCKTIPQSEWLNPLLSFFVDVLSNHLWPLRLGQ